jgi:hypothetical protein
VDEDNLPRTIDFESPTAFAQIRQAQLRYTHKFSSHITWAVAVEDNKSNIILPENIPGRAEFPSPDFATRVRFDFPDGHINASAFVGAARFRADSLLDTDNFDDVDPDTVRLWGTALSANFSTVGRDTAYGVLTYGEGIGRYRGGITAVPDETGKLQAAEAVALMGGYEHFWADKWSSNGVFSVGKSDDQPFYTADVNRRLTYGAVNLLYWFLGDRGWMGVEYLYGKREVFDVEPNSATAHRVQYAVRFNLP